MPASSPTLPGALTLVLLVWAELALIQAAVPGCGGAAVSFAGACLLVTGRRAPALTSPARARRALGEGLAFASAGWLVQPWLGWAAVRIHQAATGEAARLGSGGGGCTWDALAALVLAPVFEERLYRARLLPALAASMPAPAAIALAAAAFALPHGTPLRVLGTFLAGLVLGGVRHASGRLAPCVAMHAGLNAAVLWQQGAARWG